MNKVWPITVAGASGRMGQMLIEAVLGASDCELVGALDIEGSALIGQDAGRLLGQLSGIVVTHDAQKALERAQFLIDFTRPSGTLKHLELCAQLGVKAVIGTTGLSEEERAKVAHHALSVAVVFSPNMSVGVNVTLKLLERAARALADDFDIEVIEAHHRHKVDAPSGTALKMGEVMAQALGRDLKTCGVFAREGHTGEREPASIGFSTIRAGDIVGDHTVLFAGNGERLEITHKSSSRSTYAQGSLRAIRFLAHQPVGLFDMFDVLGLKD